MLSGFLPLAVVAAKARNAWFAKQPFQVSICGTHRFAMDGAADEMAHMNMLANAG